MIEVQEKKLVPALERGSRLLDFVANAAERPTLTDIARELDLPKSSAHGLCNTLTALGLLRRNSDQTFQIGPHVMRWANSFTRETNVVKEFAEIWDRESFLPGATVTLSVMEAGEVVYVAARNSGAIAGFNFRIGMRLPAPFTATGKCFLSFFSEAEIHALFRDGLPSPMTSRSVQDLPSLFSQLQRVRVQGFSIDNQEVADGMICVGAPILNANDHPIASIAVSLLSDALTTEQLNDVAASVREVACLMSRRMGAAKY